MINREYLEELKSRVDLRNIFGWEKVICPWHDDDMPSLMPYQDHVYCFACDKAADGISAIQEIYGYSFREAVDLMEKYRGEKLEPPKPDVSEIPIEKIKNQHKALLMSGVGVGYLQERGLRERIISDLTLGWDGRIVIPHFANGKIDNIKWRILEPENIKYDSIKNRKFNYLYPWDHFRRYFSQSPVLFITEGEFDAMVLLQEGIPSLSVPSGANTALDKWVAWLKRFKYIVFLYDMDKGGQRAINSFVKGSPSLIDKLKPTQVFRHTWNPEFGKDVTDAREHIVPEIMEMYAQVKGE